MNPVVLGKARAKQFFDEVEAGGTRATDPKERDQRRTKVMPLLLHGDAAFAGQGVVAECFALSGLAGYRTGGAMHFIVNNQIGFTTAPSFSRSSPYPSDVAKMVDAPIFHVNGDDPEAVVYAAKVATEYRQQFGKDVVIDMFCYRRFGHNEGDDPTMTQPLMYAKIRDQSSTRELYSRRLVDEGVITEDAARQHDRRDGRPPRFRVREGQDVQARRRRLARWQMGRPRPAEGRGRPRQDRRCRSPS